MNITTLKMRTKICSERNKTDSAHYQHHKSKFASFVEMSDLFQTLVLLLAVTSTSVGSGTTDSKQCPTWFYRNPEGKCQCGDPMRGVVSCDNNTESVGLLGCYCITSNDDKHLNPVIGICIINCGNHTLFENNVLYHPVSPNVSELEESTCGYLNRKGRLCSKCKERYHISAYSYDFHCYKCTSSVGYNVVKYISIAFIPLTLLYLFVLTFHISATSPQLNAFVVLCQTFATPVYVRVLIIATKNRNIFPLVQTLATVYGIWNLDFFRTVIPPICLPLNTLQILALDYLVALYPLLLLIASYAFLSAYEKEFRIVVWLWRPFHKCLARFRRPWNIRHSIIDAFATFLLLSYMKRLTTSVDLLIAVDIRNTIHAFEGYYLFYDASVPYLKDQHLAYACCATIILIVVVIFPMILLLLYPIEWFQKCLNRFKLNSQALRFFMECFQGCYRHRTDGGMECRYFAVVYPFLRLIGFIGYAIYIVNRSCSIVLGIILIAVAVVIIITRPYKAAFCVYNRIDAVMMLVLAAHFLGIAFLATPLFLFHDQTSVTFTSLLSLVPLFYISILLFRHLLPRQRITYIQKQLQRCIQCSFDREFNNPLIVNN